MHEDPYQMANGYAMPWNPKYRGKVAILDDTFSGRRKGLFLILLIGPFWISYMMRMLAWIDLLQSDGYVNKVLLFFHLIGAPVNWLGGNAITVIFGLVYGYVPYLLLALLVAPMTYFVISTSKSSRTAS